MRQALGQVIFFFAQVIPPQGVGGEINNLFAIGGQAELDYLALVQAVLLVKYSLMGGILRWREEDLYMLPAGLLGQYATPHLDGLHLAVFIVTTPIQFFHPIF